MPLDDGLGQMSHWERRGFTCRTRFDSGAGYYWQHANEIQWHGPFESRSRAQEDEARPKKRRA
jgi:hypothetical protein